MPSTLVNQVKARRIARGWTTEGLAHRAGVGGSTIRMAELGYSKGYTSDTTERLAAALGCELRLVEVDGDG